MPTKRTRTTPNADRLDALAADMQHYLKLMSPERLDRIEANIERLAAENLKAAQENASFHTAVRGAVESLAESAAKHDKAIARIEKQWEAYLRTIHPQQ